MSKINTNPDHKILIIQGRSRSQGHSRIVINHLQTLLQSDLVDLLELEFGRVDYEFRNRDDDFLPTMREITAQYDTLVFVTPVYWYSMSGIMKDFFDRISDLLKIEKETGRLLRGKNMAMISCSGSNDLVEGFGMPFRESANYLGMNYLGELHTWVEQEQVPPTVQDALAQFAEHLKAKTL